MDKKVAIITGGTSGIGLATAKLLSVNYQVVIISRNHNSDVPENFDYFKCDITDYSQVEQKVKQILDKYSRIDALINCAGVSLDAEADLETISQYEIELVLNTNLTGVTYMTRFCLPSLKSNQGTIVNISSQLGIKADPEVPLYCASKAGLIMLTKSLALRYAKSRVRVNCVCPGPTDTPLLQKYFSSHQEMEDYYSQSIPLGRMSQPEEVASLIEFLLSEKASMITGGIYSIDGGAYLKT